MKSISSKILSKVNELKKIAEKEYLPYRHYGIRFDGRLNLEEGFVFNNSKLNPDRSDLREFPVYGTPEYEAMPEAEGTCVYYVFDGDREETISNFEYFLSYADKYFDDNENDDVAWYWVGSNGTIETGEDEFEEILTDATVICKL
ncbi:MAG: hypothetical protein PUB21_07850 [Bacteroidales bacterium]|nr:hypothetical protein [Bacteroidales bacterium]